MDVPPTRYARNANGDSIAFQAFGEGPFDLVFVPGFISHVEAFWAEPAVARFYSRLGELARVITFDKRGTGLSDPVPGALPLEERMEDVRAVMDAAGSERASLVGLSEGSAMAVLFAATYPDRVRSLVLCGSIVGGPADEHPAGDRWARCCAEVEAAVQDWGTGATIRMLGPSSPATDRQLGMLERLGASPRMARELIGMWLQIDIREVLPSVSVPTLILHRAEEIFPVEAAHELARLIPDSRLVILPGEDHIPAVGDYERYLAEIAEFLTGTRERSRSDHVLATVLFTDIVGSTERAAALGDAAWRDLVGRHDDLVRRELRRFDGRLTKHTGDGMLATFDGPARAIRCARAIATAAPTELDLQVRAGVHTGECEITGGDLRGLAVHIAARVAALADPGEVLVSNTVKELVVGSELRFSERGETELKGVPGAWRIFAVSDRDLPIETGDPDQRSTLSDRAGLALARRSPRVARRVVEAERAVARVTRRAGRRSGR